MKQVKIAGKYNYNLMYDPKAIKAAVEYLDEHNPFVRVTYENIYDAIKENASKNAQFAVDDKTKDGKWDMSYVGTAGYLILFSFMEFTKNNEYPIIVASVYVTPNIGNSRILEEKIRSGK